MIFKIKNLEPGEVSTEGGISEEGRAYLCKAVFALLKDNLIAANAWSVSIDVKVAAGIVLPKDDPAMTDVA